MDIPSWAFPGAKVIWVGCKLETGMGPSKATGLARNTVYTIRDLLLHPFNGHPGCRVEEIINKLHPILGLEYGYYLAGFRPVIGERDDLETHFYQYLNTGLPVTTNEREQA